jgi:hypothetical protein
MSLYLTVTALLMALVTLLLLAVSALPPVMPA